MVDAGPAGRRLGRLERAELREAWKGEAKDFTPWLARPENIKLLGDVDDHRRFPRPDH